MNELILTNARVVQRDAVLYGATLVVRDGVIADIDEGPTGARQATDVEGDFLLPGFVELHTDNLEKHFTPRPGVRWPAANAVLAHDAQIAAAGITTVFDAVGLGEISSLGERVANMEAMFGAITTAQRAGSTRIDHRLHLRCEVTYPDVVTMFERFSALPEVGLASIMDHTPGQRQFADPEKLKYYYVKKYGMSDVAYESFVSERIDAHRRYAATHRVDLVALARQRGCALASHDDATVEHVAEAVDDGMSIAEFPTTTEAARASHEHGMAVLVGAPNVVLGGSHSGNVAAADLTRAGIADILSSDYVPSSLMEAVFALTREDVGLDQPSAVRMASLNPAWAVGLEDRGELAPGKRADFIRVRREDAGPVVREVWRQARRVA